MKIALRAVQAIKLTLDAAMYVASAYLPWTPYILIGGVWLLAAFVESALTNLCILFSTMCRMLKPQVKKKQVRSSHTRSSHFLWDPS